MKKIKALKDVGGFHSSEESVILKNRMGTFIKGAEVLVIEENKTSYYVDLENGHRYWVPKYKKNKNGFEFNFKEIEYEGKPIV